MAQVVQVLLTDDLTGEEATETVGFSLDGQAYEIDLTAANAEQLREAVSKYKDVARQIHPTARVRPVRSGSRAPKADTTEARTWLQTTGGHPEVKDRGRIPAHLMEEFNDRNKPKEVAETPATTVKARKAKPEVAVPDEIDTK
jgi:hypothetical protein